MKVTVSKYLNVRVGHPSPTAPCYQYLAPGSEIEVDGQLYAGDYYDGINTWMKDDGGNYYWSGGVAKESILINKSISINNFDSFNDVAIYPQPLLINWNTKLAKIPDVIRNNFGQNVSIAVLDTGVEKSHLDLTATLANSLDFTNNLNVGALDVNGHGTFMCSLIGGKSFGSDKGVTGIAPKCKLYSAKVMYDRYDPDDGKSVLNALKYAQQNKIDIVNLSIGITKSQDIDTLLASFNDTVVLASTRQYSQAHNPSDLLQFPASCSAVIPVAALTKEYIDSHWNDLPAPLIIIPYKKYWGASIKYYKYYKEEAGSSISTAFISGIIGLIISNKPNVKRTKASIIQELEKYASSPTEAFTNTENISFIIKK